ncbi:MAG: gliding motility-associated C-terminal domain-containing protein [Bacteroidales bacterium]
MSLKSILTLLFVCIFISLHAQKECWHWYFGAKAGIDFSSGTPVADTNSNMAAVEGVSSISDSAGNLLFYTNGMTVWNKTHTVMDNGTGLMGHQSSTQSSIVVKQPANDSIYYIFTLDAYDSFSPPTHKGFRYSTVNVHANNSFGKIIQKNVLIVNNTCEKVTVIKHCNGKDMWIIVAIRNCNIYNTYLLTDTGISTNAVISQVGVGSAPNSWCAGYMKASIDGKRITIAHLENISIGTNVELFDFNNSSGLLSNPISIGFINTVNLNPYGIEFSPDKKFLYVSYLARTLNSASHIYQYDISSNNALAISQTAVDLYWNYVPGSTTNTHSTGAMQLGCDNKIYVDFVGHTYLGVINYPDSAGLACNLVKNGVFLNGRTSNLGLPAFFPGYFNKRPDYSYNQNCLEFKFNPVCDSSSLDSISWNFGDIASVVYNSSAMYNPQHKFSDTGSYTVKVYYYYPCNRKDSVIKTINVQLPAYSFPPAYIKDTITILCKQLIFTPVCDSSSLDSLRWTFGDIASGLSDNSTLYNPQHTFSDIGTYQVQLILYAYCRTDTIYKTVTVRLPIQSIYLGADTTLCNQDSLQLGLQIHSVLPTTYQWQNATNNPTFTVTQAGTYSVNVNAGGCYFSDSIIVNYQLTPKIILPDDTIICEDNRIDFDIPPGNYSLLWDNGSTFFNRIFTQAGNYWITATNLCGSITDNFVLQTKNCNCYLYFPNAFTPDGNGLNECYGAIYNCEFETYHFYIYNRWGQLLFETNHPDECWDGKYKNEVVLTDVYVWILEYKSIYDGEMIVRKGNMVVLR